MMYLYIQIYILLGCHAVYYYIKSYTRYHDLTNSSLDIIGLVFVFIFPIFSHFATFCMYSPIHNNEKSEIIIRKKEKKDKNKDILRCAVNAIYFNDGSDYLRTLYQIVSIMTDDEETITDEKINKLFKKMNDE